MKKEKVKYTCVIFETFEDSEVTKPTNTKIGSVNKGI